MNIFHENNWGFIIYDEVHTLPAPVFRAAAEIQATRRLGLTATLVREDGKEDDVFSLIGPKKYDLPWKILEKQGWIAEAQCTEIRIEIPEELKMQYAVSDSKNKFKKGEISTLIVSKVANFAIDLPDASVAIQV